MIMYAPGDHVRLTQATVELGFAEYCVVESVSPSETDQYLVRFDDGSLRRVNFTQIDGWGYKL